MDRPYHHGALKDALLTAAERMLERDGVGALTLRAVAREAGVSHGSPAHHFRDFATLLSMVAARGFNHLEAAMTAEGAAGMQPDGRLRGLGRGYVQFARENPNLFLLMFRSDQLDDGNAALAAARSAAFNVLTGGDQDPAVIVRATGRWAIAHGLALLAIDGRLRPVGARVKLDEAALVTAVLDIDAN